MPLSRMEPSFFPLLPCNIRNKALIQLGVNMNVKELVKRKKVESFLMCAMVPTTKKTMQIAKWMKK